MLCSRSPNAIIASCILLLAFSFPNAPKVKLSSQEGQARSRTPLLLHDLDALVHARTCVHVLVSSRPPLLPFEQQIINLAYPAQRSPCTVRRKQAWTRKASMWARGKWNWRAGSATRAPGRKALPRLSPSPKLAWKGPTTPRPKKS